MFRSKTFHRKKILIIFMVVFFALLFLVGRLYYADFLPDASVAILAAMLWRAIFYYPFLVMGTLVLPKWIARN